MSNDSQAVLNILITELQAMLVALKKDTPENFRRKANNFLLSQFDPDVLFYTVFTSSFESKSGNALENCAKAIARLRYGPDSVPCIIRGLGATDEDIKSYPVPAIDRQIILTRTKIGEVTRHASSVLSSHRKSGRGKNRTTATGVNQKILQNEIINSSYKESDVLEEKPIDLFVRVSDTEGLCMEVKLGGDLDSSNAPAQLAKFLTTCAIAGTPQIEGYFATIYNKDGEGKQFTGTVRSYLADDMILAGSHFWMKILPTGISFDDFIRLYHEALETIGMNSAIREMVDAYVPVSESKKAEMIDELAK